ncbi:MAG TPA: nucleotidyltransferase family protein [Gaiellaceae bacterium]|nr:nucleotidyltransferase family protein [Gaiellaceae bacterium]
MKAIVLAAGYATRLYPLTLNQPKPLLPVGGRPMLDRLLESLAGVGMDRTYVVTNGKFAPHFRAWAADRPDVSVLDDGTTSDQDKLGAIGDIAFVLEQAELDDDLVVVAGDNLFSEDLTAFGDFCRERAAPVIAVYDVGDLAQMSKYNAIEIDGEGRITYFEEKPANAASTLTGIALYFYPRQVLQLIRQYVADGNNPDQPGRLIQWLYPRTAVYTWLVPGTWYDIGSAETLREADEVFSRS